MRLARPFLVVALFIAPVGGQIVSADHLQCPATGEQICVPGKVAGRVVCADAEGVVEHASASEYCLTCHQAQTPRSARTGGERCVTAFGHRLEMAYPAGQRGFRQVDELYEAIVLTGGKVTCESCHGGNDANRHYLSTHPRSPNLCLQCHVK